MTPLLQECVTQSLFGGFRQIFVLLVVVVDDAAIGQRQIGEKMMRADDTPDRKIGHRRVDMGHEVKPARADP